MHLQMNVSLKSVSGYGPGLLPFLRRHEGNHCDHFYDHHGVREIVHPSAKSVSKAILNRARASITRLKGTTKAGAYVTFCDYFVECAIHFAGGYKM
jgi:hypothetical protein